MEYIPCAFANTAEPPAKSDFVAMRAIEETNGDITLTEIQTQYYPHPEAPADALLTVMAPAATLRIDRHHPLYPAAYLFLQSLKNLRAAQKNFC